MARVGDRGAKANKVEPEGRGSRNSRLYYGSSKAKTIFTAEDINEENGDIKRSVLSPEQRLLGSTSRGGNCLSHGETEERNIKEQSKELILLNAAYCTYKEDSHYDSST